MFQSPNWKIFLYDLLYFVEMKILCITLFYGPQINHEVRPVILFAHMTTRHYCIIRGLSSRCKVQGWNEIPPSAS